MRAIDKKRRRTIQEIATARRKNAAGMGKPTGLRVLKRSSKKSQIEAIKADQEGTELPETATVSSDKPKPKKNKLLSQVKRKKRSCSSCWG